MTYFFRSNSGAFVGGANNRSVPESIHMDPLHRQIERLASAIPTVNCHATPTGIQLEPTKPDGLPVSVDKSGGRQTVVIGSWYDDVDDGTAVLSLVEKAISGQLRLRMEGDGKTFHTFTVETHVRDDIWAELGQMADCGFRKKPTRVVKYLCNELADCR